MAELSNDVWVTSLIVTITTLELLALRVGVTLGEDDESVTLVRCAVLGAREVNSSENSERVTLAVTLALITVLFLAPAVLVALEMFCVPWNVRVTIRVGVACVMCDKVLFVTTGVLLIRMDVFSDCVLNVTLTEPLGKIEDDDSYNECVSQFKINH